MSNIYGYDADITFDDGIITDEITDFTDTTNITLNTDTIDFDTVNLTHNGVPIGAGSGVTNPLSANLLGAGFDINNVDILKTNRVQNQAGGNNIQLSTTDIQISGDINMLTNEITNTSKVEITTTGAGTALEATAGFGPVIISNGSLFSPNLELNVDSGAVQVKKNNKTSGGHQSGISISVETVSSYSNLNVPLNCVSIATTATSNHTATDRACDYSISTTKDGVSGTNERFRIGSDDTTYVSGKLNVTEGVDILGVAQHRLPGSDNFNVSDDSTPFALNYFNVNNTGVLSQLNHQFSQGLKATVDTVGDIGTLTNQFNDAFFSGEVKCSSLTVDTINTGTALHGQYSNVGADIVIENTTAITNIAVGGVGSLVIPANKTSLGGSMRLVMSGEISTDSKNEELELVFALNGTTVSTTLFVDLEDLKVDVPWRYEMDFIAKSIGVTGDLCATGIFQYIKNLTNGNVLRGFTGHTMSVIDTTINQTLTVTGQWSNALADNKFTCCQLTITKLY